MSARAIYAVLAAYAAGFALSPPRVLLIADEVQYVTQALAFAQGRATLPDAAPIYPPTTLTVASNYPPGTSLLQTPFVASFGWRGAAILSVLSFVAATLLTMRWLAAAGYDRRFALLVPAFVPALFFGRVAMSDMPSTALVALALWLLWRAEGVGVGVGRGWQWSFAAGLACGSTLMLREPLILLLAPLAIGAIVRRRCVPWALFAGGLIALAARAAVFHWMFGSALYVRDAGYGFSVASVPTNLPQYAVILLVMFPLGALLPVFYKGPRRAEVVTAFALYVTLFLLFEYDSVRDNGRLKGLLLVSRYMLPALPLMVLMAADVFPRWVASAGASVRPRWLMPAVATVLAIMAFGIHVAVRRLESAPRSVVAAFQENTTATGPVITNHHATLKYLATPYGGRRLITRESMQPSDVGRFQKQYGALTIAFLDRTDSEMFRADAANNDRFLGEVRQRCVLQPRYDAEHPGTGRVRVLSVVGCN